MLLWCRVVEGLGEAQAKAMPDMLSVLSMAASADVVTSLEASCWLSLPFSRDIVEEPARLVLPRAVVSAIIGSGLGSE